MSDNIIELDKTKNKNKNFPKQNFDFIEDEYWKPVIFHGKVIERYTVSNYGNVIGPQGRKLKWTTRSKTAPYPAVSLACPTNLFEHSYRKTNAIVVYVHTLVATAFLPLDENIPKVFDDYIEIDGSPKHVWSLFPESTKFWIRSVLHVDHIDDDKGNPHVDNLMFTTPYENNVHVKRALNESNNK